MSSQAGLNVVSALSSRAQREQEAQEDWEDSIKPSTVTGNGQIKQLGSNPLASNRILTNTTRGTGAIATTSTVGGLIGDWVPRFESEEEVRTVTKEKIGYSAIFTREVPGNRTQWTGWEMLQRTSNFNSSNWEWTGSVITNLASIFNDRIFYYWNGSTIQELFTHQSASVLISGTSSVSTETVLGSFPAPSTFENGTPRTANSIARNLVRRYLVMYQGSLLFNRVVLKDSAGNEINSTTFSLPTVAGSAYRTALLLYTDSDVASHPGPWSIVLERSTSLALSITWEVHEIFNHGAYFTTTGKGTAFAHITNGCNGDGKTRIRYFSGSGKQPVSLTETTLNQTQAELYWQSEPAVTRLSYPSYDWRSPWLTTDSSFVENNSQLYFYGMTWDAIQYNSATSKPNGFRYQKSYGSSNPATTISDIFTGSGLTFDIAERITAFDYDSTTGYLDYSSGDSIELTFPGININEFGVEGVDYYLEDICTPDVTTANNVTGLYGWIPFLAVFPYYLKR